MAHYFSASTCSFYDDEFKAVYDAAGTWPEDAQEVTPDQFTKFALTPAPAGKVRGASKKGQPIWVDASPPTVDEVIAQLESAVRQHINAQAQALGYDDIATAVTYAEEPAVPLFQRQGQALRAWRSLVWAACHEALADVRAGKKSAPSAADFLASMPEFVAPA